MKFAFSNAYSIDEAEIVLFGVPAESGLSVYARRGTAHGPAAIRAASHEAKWLAGAALTKIYDAGDIPKHRVAAFVEKLVREGRRPVCLGGDHSITFEVLRGIGAVRPVGLATFGAHADFMSSGGHGSVICGDDDYGRINLRRAVEVGVRQGEVELSEARAKRVNTIPMADIVDMGVGRIAKSLGRFSGKGCYISVDLSVLDPIFAPGVGAPIPGGISSADLLWLVGGLAEEALGLDVMELNPSFDVDGKTAQIAVKLILEFCGRRPKFGRCRKASPSCA
jgi:arginase family enzyme